MADLHSPPIGPAGKFPFRSYEPPLTRYFNELAAKNHLVVQTNPADPHAAPVPFRQAADPISGARLSLVLILERYDAHEFGMDFIKPLPNTRVMELCDELGIEHVLLNSDYFARQSGQKTWRVFNVQGQTYDDLVLPPNDIAQVRFQAVPYDCSDIKLIGGYLTRFLSLARTCAIQEAS